MKNLVYKACALFTAFSLILSAEIPAHAMEDTANDPAEETAVSEVVNEEEENEEAVLEAAAEGKIPFDGSEEHFTVTCLSENILYDGTPKEPEYQIVFKNGTGERTLKKGTDYQVEYADTVGPGYGEAKFTSAGDSEIEAGFFYEYYEIAYIPDIKDFNVTISGNSLTVVNNMSFNVYFTVMKGGEEYDEVTGEEVESGKSGTLHYCYDKGGRARSINPDTAYDLYACYYPYMPTVKKAAEEFHVVKIKEFTTPGAPAPVRPEGYEDGFTKIKFKAVTQKNGSVKFSWSPNSKEYPDYKKYKLFVPDDAGGFTRQIWPLTKTGVPDVPKSSKSATIKEDKANGFTKSPVVCLVCYDKDGNEQKGRFLTTIAPYIYDVRSGDETDEQIFTFSGPAMDSELSFSLQAGDKNKDENYILASVVPSLGTDEIEYDVSSKQKETVTITEFYAGDTNGGKLTLGNKYFFRVKSVYDYHGLTVTSAPSNAFGVKAGPAKCTIMNISGCEPVKEIEADKAGKTFEESDYHVHYSNETTCYKKGYVVFRYPENINSSVSSVELLRCATEHGKYKSVKKFKPSAVKPVDYAYWGYDADYSYYYLTYDKFPPEELWYYAVRVVSTQGKAAGGYDDGYANYTRFDKVQDIVAGDTGEIGIYFCWLHDDCAKKYYIYCGSTNEELQSNLRSGVVKKKISGSSTKKTTINGETVRYHVYEDNKVAAGTKYWYAIRPVYNEKVAKNQSYDEFSYALFETGEIEATAEGMSIKTVKVSNYSVKELNVTWSALKPKNSKQNKVTSYEIQRKKSSDPDTAWAKVFTAFEGQPEYKSRSLVDIVPEVGTNYVYRVKGYINEKETSWDESYVKGSPKGGSTRPLPVNSITVEKQSGSDYSLGGIVRFSLNSKDLRWAGTVPLTYTLRASDVSQALATGQVYSGTGNYSYKDSRYLKRGATRKYSVVITSGTVSGESRSVDYTKTTNLEISGNTTVEVGSTTTIKVSPNYSVKDLDSVTGSDNSIIKIKEIDKDGDGNTIIKVTGVKPGGAYIRVKAYRSEWTDGSSSANLSKSIMITVKAKPVVPTK